MATIAEVEKLAGRGRSRVYTKDRKKLVFSQRLKIGGIRHEESGLLMCGIGNDAGGFLFKKGAVISEALVPFGQAQPFQGGYDRSGGVE
jgi:hypothetical protein